MPSCHTRISYALSNASSVYNNLNRNSHFPYGTQTAERVESGVGARENVMETIRMSTKLYALGIYIYNNANKVEI